MPLRGVMPTWALTPFAMSPTYIGLWYAFGSDRRFSSPTFGAAKQMFPMPVWGAVLLTIALWLWVAIFLHREAAYDARGSITTWRTLFLSIGLVAGGAFAAWWAVVGSFQAARNPDATPTGIGWLGLVSFAYILAAIRVASGRGA